MPTNADLFNLAVRHHQSGNLAEAEPLYWQILQADPGHAGALHLLGVLAHQTGQHQLAIALIQNAINLRPAEFAFHSNLGAAYAAMQQTTEAIACFRQALVLRPDYVEAHYNLGNALRTQGLLSEAAASYREAVRLLPDLQECQCNLGCVLMELGRYDEAGAHFEKALRLAPTNKIALWNSSMLRLLHGDFEGGWRDYELRWAQPGIVPRAFTQPRWDGSSLHGRTILLHTEQGFGDALQFVRYAPLVKQHGGTVLLDCPPELVRVLQTCPGIDHVLTRGSPTPAFDCQAPLLSLPAILKTSLATVPAAVPYLAADASLTERWGAELSPYSGFRIGIIWQGNPRMAQPECRPWDKRRSIPLAQFAVLARLPAVRLFSLQKGFGTEQLAEWRERLHIVDLAERLTDFMDTAAVMMNLDLIISADTSPTHLAGALARKVWTVLPFAGCWRWLEERADSPWYPTMRLFRQKAPGAWGEVFERMAVELGTLTGARGN